MVLFDVPPKIVLSRKTLLAIQIPAAEIWLGFTMSGLFVALEIASSGERLDAIRTFVRLFVRLFMATKDCRVSFYPLHCQNLIPQRLTA
jgi:hypothetical protein